MASAPHVVQILGQLARQPAAPFHEHAVAREASAIARASGARVRADAFGNLVIAPPGRRPGPPVWLVAHMDHPGLEVTGRREAVFLGGVGAEYFRRGIGLRFYHDGKPIAAKLGRARLTKRPWRLTLGGPEARHLRRGDFGVLELGDFRLAGDRVHARQLDDLAGCAVSLAVVERACGNRTLNVRALLTRAEEVGFVGTLGAISSHLVPRSAWIINVEASKAIPGVSIGGGPVIRVGDRASTFDPKAEDLLVAARSRLGPDRPVQRALMSGGTCEATAWNLLGYRATGVAIPLGNYHNQGAGRRLRPEVVSARDLATAVDLVELAGHQLPKAQRWADARRNRLLRYLRQHGRKLKSTRG